MSKETISLIHQMQWSLDNTKSAMLQAQSTFAQSGPFAREVDSMIEQLNQMIYMLNQMEFAYTPLPGNEPDAHTEDKPLTDKWIG